MRLGKDSFNISSTCRYVRTILFSVLSSISICMEPHILDEYQSNNILSRLIELFDAGLINFTLISTSIFALVCIVYYLTEKITLRSKMTAITAVVFAIFTILGKSYASFNSWDYIFNNKTQFVFAIIIMIGFAAIYYAMIKGIYYFIDTRRLVQKESKNVWVPNKKKFFLVYGVIFACWIPYLIVFYPGSVPYDGYYQLNMFYGISPASNHHPWLSTLVIGLITMLGRNFNDNFGVFLYILFQSLFCAFAFSVVCCKIFNYRISKWIKIGAILFFAILPVWGAYAQTLMKDVVYYGLFALFSVLYVEIVESKCALSKKKMFAFILLGCLLVQYRNEGIYIIGASLFLLILIVKSSSRLKLFSAGGIIIVCHLIFVMLIFPAMGVEKGSEKEMLSVPFQQTARYSVTYENEITEREIAIIDKVLNYETIKNKYNPINSDPVKNSYKSPSKEDFVNYIKVWYEQLKKHPTCYVQATLNNCFGYLYPGYIQNSISNMQFYIKGEPLATGDLNIYYIQNDVLRKSLSQYSLMWLKIPGMSLLLYPGTYSWMVVLGIIELIRYRKYKECVSASLIVFTIAICLISPVNGYLRYMLPVMATMPLFVGFVINVLCEARSN